MVLDYFARAKDYLAVAKDYIGPAAENFAKDYVAPAAKHVAKDYIGPAAEYLSEAKKNLAPAAEKLAKEYIAPTAKNLARDYIAPAAEYLAEAKKNMAPAAEKLVKDYVEPAAEYLAPAADYLVPAAVGIGAWVGAPVILTALGFTVRGIAAGSLASLFQGYFYAGATGGIFSALQAAGAGGISILTKAALASMASGAVKTMYSAEDGTVYRYDPECTKQDNSCQSLEKNVEKDLAQFAKCRENLKHLSQSDRHQLKSSLDFIDFVIWEPSVSAEEHEAFLTLYPQVLHNCAYFTDLYSVDSDSNATPIV